MQTDWTPLRQELARCRAAGVPLPVWWRDDDAVTHTPALDRLCGLSEDLGLAVHIAVIPEPADQTLAAAVSAHSCLVPLVHGWQHINHSCEGQKKAEFGRVRASAAGELDAGLKRLKHLFGSRLLPVFVPPWNRLDPGFCNDLAHLGYAGVSTFLPRVSRCAAPGLMQVNTHIDPISWHGGRGLVLPETLVKLTVQTLTDRRAGKTDPAEPLGLLTHHLVHDEEVWQFSGRWVREMLDGGAEPSSPLQQESPDEQA
ncbi:polysaccharide deacetylase family protein [uncultured Roseobacter sp.]|uniref:polysaccharide deacetylase family protein n=1 Tax=uncultured Roseobacter sp. TaxID=114847 RepID=UPI002618B010|nr:polysaccharide deacetylase family protein [uncultured Roseobacter sp.]